MPVVSGICRFQTSASGPNFGETTRPQRLHPPLGGCDPPHVVSIHRRTREAGQVPADERTIGYEGGLLATVSEEDGLPSASSNTIYPGVRSADSPALKRYR